MDVKRKLQGLGAHGIMSMLEVIEYLLVSRSQKLETANDTTELIRVQGEVRSLRFLQSALRESRK